MHSPALIWLPAQRKGWEEPIQIIKIHHLEKRAVGMLILVISLIIAALASTATAVASLMKQQSTAEALNSLSTQSLIDRHRQVAILVLQQQINLLAEQQMSWQVVHATCDPRYMALCN